MIKNTYESYICGIDFGTSNSALALAPNNDSRDCQETEGLVPIEGRKPVMPSAIFYPHTVGATPFFGRAAQQQFLEGHEGRLLRSLKRALGTSLMKQGKLIGNKRMKLGDIIATYIGHMKHTAEAQTQHDLEAVVMGRPVHFVDNDPEADNRAENELAEIAKLIGFKQVSFQFEPIAGALAYEQNCAKETLALVVDIGGGTSDFTVIRLSRTAMKKSDRSQDILANTGVRIGGTDFDKHLTLETIMPHLGYDSHYGAKNLTVPRSPYHDMADWSRVNSFYTAQQRREAQEILRQSHDPQRYQRFVTALKQEYGHTILDVAEHGKIALTEKQRAQLNLDFLEAYLAIEIAKDDMVTAIDDNVSAMVSCAQRCLDDAQIGKEDIQMVILTGGSTAVKHVQNSFRQVFTQAVFRDDNRLSSVAQGLALEAVRRYQ